MINPGQSQSGMRRRAQLNSEINVTPFVDVMLVLLIIFMVAAPMMTAGVAIDLPRAALTDLPPEEQPLEVFIKRDGGLFLGDRPVAMEALAAAVSNLPPGVKEQRVRVRADHDVAYERVIALIEILTSQGFARVGLVAAPRSSENQP